jgi:hypothetical protein
MKSRRNVKPSSFYASAPNLTVGILRKKAAIKRKNRSPNEGLFIIQGCFAANCWPLIKYERQDRHVELSSCCTKS